MNTAFRKVTGLALLACMGIFALPCRGELLDSLPDLDQDIANLEQWRMDQHQRLATQQATPAQHKAIDDEFLNRARDLEFKRTRVLDALGKKAGVGPVRQGDYGTDPTKGRGITGDVDTKSYSPKEYDRLLREAQKMYGKGNVEVRGDSFTIKGKGLNTTVHRAASKFKSPTGSSAAQMEAGRGFDAESSRTMGAKPTPAVQSAKVSDNLAKGGHTLNKPAGSMTSADYQELGKMTIRNMDAAGINDPVLRQQAEMLKQGYRPESAGIKNPQQFQAQAAKVNMEAAHKTVTAAQVHEAELTEKIRAATAQGGTKEAAALRKQLAEHRQLSDAAKKTLEAKQPDLAKQVHAEKTSFKEKAGKVAGDYAKGAIIIGRAAKVREGIQEGDEEKALSGIVGEDTAARAMSPEGQKYAEEMDQLQETRAQEVEAELAAKLRRMGATKEEADAYTEARARSDGSATREIVDAVKERGGTDTAPRGFDIDAPDDTSWTLKEQLADGIAQAGEYALVPVDTVSLGGVSKGRAAQKDLDVIEQEADYVFDATEENVNQTLNLALRDRGATKEEAEAYTRARQHGDVEGQREIVEGIKERGDWQDDARPRTLEASDAVDVQEDESAGQRIVDTFKDAGIGMKKTFIDTPYEYTRDTAVDLIEIAGGEDLAKELRDPRTIRSLNADTQTRTEGKREEIIEYLESMGASPVGAKRAADALVDHGDASEFRRLAEVRKQRMAEKEENKNDLRDMEADCDGTEDISRNIASQSGRLLDGMVTSRDQKVIERTEGALSKMQHQTEIARAETASEQRLWDARLTRDAAGSQAQKIRRESVARTVSAEREDSWSREIGNAIETGITAGGAAFGTAIGAAAADQATSRIFDRGQSEEPGSSGGSSADSSDPSSGQGPDGAPVQTASVGGGGAAPHGGGSAGGGPSKGKAGGKKKKGGAGGGADKADGSSSAPSDISGMVPMCMRCGQTTVVRGTMTQVGGKVLPCHRCAKCNQIVVNFVSPEKVKPTATAKPAPKPAPQPPQEKRQWHLYCRREGCGHYPIAQHPPGPKDDVLYWLICPKCGWKIGMSKGY